MRFKPSGVIDSSFGTTGIVKTPFFGFNANIKQVVIDYSNRVVAGGFTYSADPVCGLYVCDFAIVRYLEAGSLDVSFGGGKQLVDFYGGNDQLGERGLTVQADNKIVGVGINIFAAGVQYFGLVRFNNDGSRDSSFGPLGDGLVTTLFGPYAQAIAVAVDPIDGKIVAAGSAGSPPGDLSVVRYWP